MMCDVMKDLMNYQVTLINLFVYSSVNSTEHLWSPVSYPFSVQTCHPTRGSCSPATVATASTASVQTDTDTSPSGRRISTGG